MKHRYWTLIPVILICIVLGGMMTAAAEETIVSLHEDLPAKKGMTTIEWDVTGKEPGNFYVYLKAINTKAEQPERLIGKTKSHKIETAECIPGKYYEITVKDKNGNVLDHKCYKMDDAEDFKDGKLNINSIRVSINFQRAKKSNRTNFSMIKTLKAKEIIDSLSGVGYDYGIQLQMRLPELKRERTYLVMIAYESPDKYFYVETKEKMIFKAVTEVGYGYHYYTLNMSGYDFLRDLYENTGTIPTGKYKIRVFWNGMKVDTLTFNIK